MKMLNLLTQQFEEWRQCAKSATASLPQLPLRLLFPSRVYDNLPARARQHYTPNPPTTSSKHRSSRPPVVLLLAVVSLTGTMGHRFYNPPRLDVGKTAPETIKAPKDASVEDLKTTEEKRKDARTGAVAVLMINQDVTQQVYEDVERSLSYGDEIRDMAGGFPVVPTTVLSSAAQIDLRNASDSEWVSMLAATDARNGQLTPKKQETPTTSLPGVQGQPPNEQNQESLFINSSLLGISSVFNVSVSPALTEIKAYRQAASPQKWKELIDSITTARQRYAIARAALEAEGKSKSRFDASLLNLSNNDWISMQMGVREAATRILSQGIPPGLPPEILEPAVRIHISSLVPNDAEPIATSLLVELIKPNLIEDKEQTKRRAEQAAQAVKPEMVTIRRGDAIVREGEIITNADFLLLEHFKLSQRGISWRGIVGFGSLVCIGVGVFCFVQRRFNPHLRQRDQLLVLLLTLSTPLLMPLGVFYTNLAAIGLLAGSFYGFPIGATVVGLLTGVLSIGFEIGWDYLLAGAAGATLVSLMSARMRSREELALLGIAVGLTQGGVFLVTNLIISASAGAVLYTVLQEAALYGLSGLAWSIVALGLSPYLEHLFDLVTPIRLAELANPNRPLLKRLAAETPGTFQHILFVATLAEAAARVLGCNVELVRAGTLYHDIGKMHDPLGFIENQMGGPNKHDEINDPWKSAEIIKKHVSEGLVMARKYRLPKAIRAFIPEHQGTILIAYFYHQAQQLAQQDPSIELREEDFRYDGPIPQSRETGIVMLADACEAALRSLKEATPEQALSTINKILRARWKDNQLLDCGLTREDLSTIAEVFVQVWQQYNHQRIAYPKVVTCK